MTREDIKDFCDMKAQLEPENEDIYKEIVKILEQETVSKESYDHEYFLRKEFEIKIGIILLGIWMLMVIRDIYVIEKELEHLKWLIEKKLGIEVGNGNDN